MMNRTNNNYEYRKLVVGVIILLFFSGFHTISASEVQRVYFIEDTNSFINITGGEKFNISLDAGSYYIWEFRPYDSSIIKIVDKGGWTSPEGLMGAGVIMNWTFEGKNKGDTPISLVYLDPLAGNVSIRNNFTLHVNVTSNAPMNTTWLYLIVVCVIIVVPTAILVKWFKGGREK